MSDPNKNPEPSIHDIIGDADIHDMLANQLTPSELPGYDTETFFVQGRPDLLVRTSPDMDDMEEVRQGLATTRRMQEFGVHMPLFAPVRHDNGIYVVTERVRGANLPDVVTPELPVSTLRGIDRTYAGITRHLTAAVVEGSPTIDDVYDPEQYMVGTTKSRPRRDVLLVDYPTVAEHIPEGSFSLEYPMRLMNLSQYVVNLELSADHPLPRARQALEVGLATANNPDITPYHPEAANYYVLDKTGYIDTARNILANQAQIDTGSLGHRQD